MKESVLFLTDPSWPNQEKPYWVLSEDNNFLPLHLQSLAGNIDTDQIIPANHVLSSENLGPYALTGIPGIEKGEVKNLQPTILIGGENFGCGSAREHAPISLKDAGIEFIFAPYFDETFKNNCINLGISPITDLMLANKLIDEGVTREDLKSAAASELEGIQKDILEYGGLFAYNQARIEGRIQTPEIKTDTRPMTIAEKIIARHLGENVFVKPGDQAFASIDWRMSYEVFVPLMENLLKHYVPDFEIQDPQSIVLFIDHFVANCMNDNHPFHALVTTQQQFAKKHGINLHYENAQDCALGICHPKMIEGHLLPGQLWAGTDSHSTMGGVLNALGLPIGATALANALINKETLVRVPASIKISFNNGLTKDVSARDVILKIMQIIPLRQIKGKVIEFDVNNLDWSIDEMAVLTCLSKELGALTAIISPNERIIRHLQKTRFLSEKEVEEMFVKADESAEYAGEFAVDLQDVEPMFLPPPIAGFQKPITVSQLEQEVLIQKAIIGGCAGGKLEDLRMAAEILKDNQVAEGVQLFVQPATILIWAQAEKEGLLDIFKNAGAQILPPSCGACIGQGPSRIKKDEIAVANTTRNHLGRMGDGPVWLASAKTVAMAALEGKIHSTKHT